MSGAELIVAERRRQTEAEGWTSEHDAAHRNGALAWAAACYAAPEVIFRVRVNDDGVEWWHPWPRNWRRPEADRVRELVKAGALIAAEIDRLQATS